MKRSLVLAAGAVLVAAAVSAFVYVSCGRNFMDDLFNANVEALASQETGYEDLKDSRWWVNENDPHAIICTPGGNDACQ